MKKFGKIIALILTAAALLSLTACGQIEDTNGAEDMSLCSLTEEDIFADTTSHVSVASVKSQINGQQSYKAKKLSGVVDVSEHNSHCKTMTLTYAISLTQGNLRAILLCNGEYVQDLAIGEYEELTFHDTDGTYEIRLAAESAEVDLSAEWSNVE